MKKRSWSLKIADVLMLLVFAGVIAASLMIAGTGASSAERVLIEVDGTEYVYSLSEDRTIELTGAAGPAVLVIEDGTIRFEDSTCRDLTCVHMGKVGPEHAHFAACLPNRIIVTLEGEENDELDW